MKLVSVSEFILQQAEEINKETSPAEHFNKRAGGFDLSVRYAQFLNQPIEVRLFTPIFEGKPIKWDGEDAYIWRGSRMVYLELKDIIKAEQDVLFLTKSESDVICDAIGYHQRLKRKLSHLIPFGENFELTKTAKKQIGL